MKLMPYQQTGAEFLAARNFAFLADGMGLGKTAQAIEACNILKAPRIVVVCPAVARVNWVREFDLWGRISDIKLKVWTYDKLAIDKKTRQEFADFEPDVLILDEAHYLKTRTTKRTLAVYGKHCTHTGVASKARHVWLLSGTPCPNNVSELYPHLRALWPDLISGADGKPLNFVEFIQKFCVTQATPFGLKILANKNKDQIKFVLRQIMLRRRAEDVLTDLPPMSWHMVPVEADSVLDDVRDLEQDMAVLALKEALTADGVIEGAAVALASLRRATGLAKASLAARLIADELENNAYDKIVVFHQHLDVGKTLIHDLAQFGVVSISGSTTNTMRQNAIDNFQANPKVRVFIGQIQACNTAITLHASNQVLFVEQSWTPSENAQAAKRCHRIGQTRPVFVRMLGLAKSVDEAVAKVLARKSQMITELLEEQ